MKTISNNNIYILTEESISIVEISKILKELSIKKNIEIKFKDLKIIPTILNNRFYHEYKAYNFTSNQVKEIYIYGVGAPSKSPFVDFLVYFQASKPSPEQLFENCVFAIEATKTNNNDSRNTSLGQRAGKFVHLNYYLENKKYNTTPIMFKTHEQKDDTDSVRFIGKLLNHLPVKTEFWGTKDFSYPKFESLDDLSTEKNNIADKNDRTNDTPIYIRRELNKIKVSGRLSNPGSTGSKKDNYTGKIGHDPNQGQLAIIAKSIRNFSATEKIIINDHDLISKEVLKQNNKFIKFANYIDFEIDGCEIQKSTFNETYFQYLTKNNEKIASILAQVILVNKGMKTIFENHGGCEKSFIYLDLINKDVEIKYKEFPKNYSQGKRKIPDLIMLDEQTKTIYLYEGKQSKTKHKGLEEIEYYNDLENDILAKYYPNYTFKRRLIIEGGKKDDNSIITFQLDEDNFVIIKDEFL